MCPIQYSILAFLLPLSDNSIPEFTVLVFVNLDNVWEKLSNEVKISGIWKFLRMSSKNSEKCYFHMVLP